MRLKEDKSSWKASNVLRKVTPLPEEPVHRSHKSTRKWCRGVVGRKHEYEKYKKYLWGKAYLELDKCSKCGKEKYGKFHLNDNVE